MKYLSVPNSFFISFFLFLPIIRFEKLLFIEIFPSIEVKMENNICNKNEQKYITKKKEKSRIIIHFQTDISIIRLRSIRKHCRKRPLNRDGLIDSLARYARSRRTRNVRRSGGTRPIDSSVHRHARQVTRRGRSRNCHAEAREVCVYSLARSVPAWPVATLVLWPGYLRSYIPLPRIPSCLSRLSLSRTHSCPFCTETRRCHSNIWFTVPLNRMPPAPPFFAKPSPRPNSCRGRNRVCVYVRAASILHSRFAYLDEACGLDRGIGIAFSFFFLIGYRLYS